MSTRNVRQTTTWTQGSKWKDYASSREQSLIEGGNQRQAVSLNELRHDAESCSHDMCWALVNVGTICKSEAQVVLGHGSSEEFHTTSGDCR